MITVCSKNPEGLFFLAFLVKTLIFTKFSSLSVAKTRARSFMTHDPNIENVQNEQDFAVVKKLKQEASF